jgi:hypothetical protein
MPLLVHLEDQYEAGRIAPESTQSMGNVTGCQGMPIELAWLLLVRRYAAWRSPFASSGLAAVPSLWIKLWTRWWKRY